MDLLNRKEIKTSSCTYQLWKKLGSAPLKEGEEIEFEIGENKGKQNAINVKKVGHEGEDNRPAEDSL